MDILRRLTIAVLLVGACSGLTDPEPQTYECVPYTPNTFVAVNGPNPMTLVVGSADVLWIEHGVEDGCSYEALPLTNLTAGVRDSSVVSANLRGTTEVLVEPRQPGSTWLVLESAEFSDSVRVMVPDTATMANATAVAASHSITCAIEDGGQVFCWGGNSWDLMGRFNDPTIGTCFGTPCSPWPKAREGWQADRLTLGRGSACLIQGSDWGCWQNGGLRSFRNPSLVTLTVAWSHTCGLTAAGEAYCWGDNAMGQVGDDRLGVYADVPQRVIGPGPWTSIWAEDGSTCAVSSSGLLHCWGRLPEGVDAPNTCQVSTGGKNSASVDVPCADEPWPVPMSSSPGIGADTLMAEVAGRCVLTGTGAVHCTEQVATRFEPVAPSGSFTALYAGDSHHCGLAADGSAHCWGDNHDGQLGAPGPLSSRVPVPVRGGHTFVELALGDLHSCGLDTDGIVWCWGANYAGQAGGHILDAPTEPRRVPGQGGP